VSDSTRDHHLQPINRRQFLRRAALLGLSMAGSSILPAACGNPPASPQAAPTADRLMSVRMASWSQPLTEQTNIYAAQEFGWFKQQGLDFTFVPGAGGGDALKHILAGNADFAFTNVEPLFFALQEGAKLRAVYNIYPQNVFNLVALKRSNIGSIADLKGRKVGVYSQSSGTRYNLLVMLHSVGLRESDVEVIATGIANFGPLQAGEVDATAATDTGLYAAQQGGLGDADVWWARDVLNTPSDVFVVTEETYQNQQDMIVRFLKAYKQGSQWMLEHPDKAAELATNYATDGKDVERNRVIIDLRNTSTVSATTETKGLGFFDLELLKEVESTFFDLGITKQRFDVENIFTNEFVSNV
jgi:NitT/TauT family transport system substrate-binding protein